MPTDDAPRRDYLPPMVERFPLALPATRFVYEAVFLAKLALVLAHRAGAGVDFADCVETAARDLDVVARPLGTA